MTERRALILKSKTFLLLFFFTTSLQAKDSYDVDAVLFEASRNVPYGSQSSAGATAATKTDFESILRLLVQGGDLGDILAEEFAEVEWNIRTNRYGTWSLRGSGDQNPELYPMLAMALDSAGQGDLKEQLSGEVGSLDVYSVELLLSPEDEESVGQLASLLAGSYQLGNRLLVMNANENLADLSAESFRELSSSEVSVAAAALDNRGKMTFSAKRTLRRGVAGPDQTDIKFTYERPLGASAQTVLQMIDRFDCGTINDVIVKIRGGLVSTLSEQCVQQFRTVPALLQDAKKGERLSVSLVYSQIDDFQFMNEPTSFSQSYRSNESFKLVAGYGRNYEHTFLEASGARLDAQFSFEDVKDDDMLNDRGLLQATYTLNFDQFSIPITLSWSNKSELVGESDAELGGHIGIQYRLKRK